MESERANKDEVVPAKPVVVVAAAVSSRGKRPDKKRQDAAKDTDGETKPKPRPRYTDKSWKNKKNNKKSGQENKTEAEAEAEAEDDAADADAKAEPSPGAQEEPPNGHPAVTEPADAHVSDDVTTDTPPVDSDKEEEDDSWDTLFNDDGDCLDSHLLEEVSTSGFGDFHDGG